MNKESKRPETRRSEGPPSSRNLSTPPEDYPEQGTEKLLMVRYGKMQQRGSFRSRTPGLVFSDKVVVQSERGIEIGEVTFGSPRDRESSVAPAGWVLRRATDPELEEHERINEPPVPGPEFRFCAERIAALGLPMRLVDVERPFGGGKIIFYFTADGRVDFRALVRDLAKRYRTRIEMKQIGVRDEAKVLGDIADCGRQLCCRTFLTRLQPISMRMAKVQKTTLDPAKISGRCGRLKCCLRYEYDAYIALRANLPRAGARVALDGRPGVVVGMDILSQEVSVLLDEGERLSVHVDQIRPTPAGGPVAAEPVKGDASGDEPAADPSTGADSGGVVDATDRAEAAPASAEPAGGEAVPGREGSAHPTGAGGRTGGGESGKGRRSGRRRGGRKRGGDRGPVPRGDAERGPSESGGGRKDSKSEGAAGDGGADRRDDGSAKRGRRRRRRGRQKKSPDSNRANGGRRSTQNDGGGSSSHEPES
jgi:cell fate regulator YaaT (PSP1 superfamily)